MERQQLQSEIPLRVIAGKLEIPATVHGQVRRFILDTGSPTVITRALADELNLRTIGQNTGTDAAGRAVTMTVAILSELQVGGLLFREVPVLVYDPVAESAVTGACLLDGGVIGSDLMPGNVWQIDLDDNVVRVVDTLDKLSLPEHAVASALHLYGFPYAPIVDWGVTGILKDKAMVDTGSPATLAVFQKAYEALKKKRGVRATSTIWGYEGEAAGGFGEIQERTEMRFPQVELGALVLKDWIAVTRNQAPTLVGAGMLHTHVLTFDYKDRQFILHTRKQPEEVMLSDFSCRWTQEGVKVIHVRRDSACWHAGIRPDMLILEANGDSLLPADQADPCSTAVWVIDTLPTLNPLVLTVQDEGSIREIQVY